MNAKKLIYDRFIAPLKKPRASYIGIEIEMPVVNLSGKKTDKSVSIAAVHKAMEHFGFTPHKFDDEGVCHEAVCDDTGDVFSFDCSYNNFEISLGRVRTLHEAQARFRDYVSFINGELNRSKHTLTGLGVNPNYKINDYNYVPSPRYRMLEGYLKKCKIWDGRFHPYFGYGTFSSASQVQLDVTEENLCKTIEAFSLVEPLKAVLFANSYLPDIPELLCVRDYFWEQSPHAINPKNVGFFEPLPKTVGEITEYLSKASIFCTERSGKYLFFYYIGKALDNRLACGILLDEIKANTTSKDDIYFVFTIQEEIGMRGIRYAKSLIKPDICIIIDTSPESDISSLVIGKGVGIKISDSVFVSSPDLVDWMRRISDKNNILYQMEVSDCGTNELIISNEHDSGYKELGISIPCQYPHTANTVVAKNDIQECKKLLSRIIAGL